MKKQLVVIPCICLLLAYSCSEKSESLLSENEMHIDIQLPLSSSPVEPVFQGETNIYYFSGSGIAGITEALAPAGGEARIYDIQPGSLSVLTIPISNQKYSVSELTIAWQAGSVSEGVHTGTVPLNLKTCGYTISENSLSIALGNELVPLFNSMSQNTGKSFTIFVSGTAEEGLIGTATLQLNAVVTTSAETPRFELF